MPTDPNLALQNYEALERRIQRNGLDDLLARWEFGSQLLKDKSARKHGEWMPVRRRISNALEISGAEINNRMQLAAEYEKDALHGVLAKYGSWHAICRSGLGNRGSDWHREWQGMPEFVQPDRRACKSIIVHFANLDDFARFAKAIDQKLTPRTRSVWYPAAKIERAVNKRYVVAA